MRPREWDAATYDRTSLPQQTWGREVVERLDLHGDERVLDAGCGTGRVTAFLVEHLPRGEVVAVDGSAAMVAETRRRFGDRADAFQCDLLDLELERPADAILSTATFHWIADHDMLFARLHAALKAGGRLVAQCGGAGNIANVVEAIEMVAHPALANWPGPWNFATPAETAERLARAGFTDIWTWLQPWPVRPEDPRAFVATSILGAHLDRLPAADRESYIDAVLDHLPTPVTAD